ncbi:hypothetical protein H696_03478 [Fonticula alba]|uniref:Rap-GAP domain-containing protein n=1 Tax=Fonticula alba TaxID=691883 RepID=A0A058Z7E9_FONAL|nr:hypothetical protein H696_03478 [Fonticula alba]KCV70011.1 hypothetical protein H696_03478 [Fonticula alba]|eukprot:XP_009495617.1 hypothetical protein H696_03478 [Fonticula alba]
MFHVSTLLPYNPSDPQQIQRKRHIGNDVCLIIFHEGDPAVGFDPTTLRSQFTHIQAVVRPIRSRRPFVASQTPVPRYRMEVCARDDVPEFAPELPAPPEFDASELREILLAKLINGERSAMEAPRFKEPHLRARARHFSFLCETYADHPITGSAPPTILFQSSAPSSSPSSMSSSGPGMPLSSSGGSSSSLLSGTAASSASLSSISSGSSSTAGGSHCGNNVPGSTGALFPLSGATISIPSSSLRP